jgi:hypothetical protein
VTSLVFGREGKDDVPVTDRESAAKVAKWLVEKGRSEEAVTLLAAWASQGPSDPEAHQLLAEALRIAPGSRVAQQAFERMEGVAAGDQVELNEAIARYTRDEVQKLEKEIARPVFRKAQVGFNNNVKYRGIAFHIQTEDSGLDKPHIITHLFADGGRIIKSHKRSYAAEVSRSDIAMYVRQLMKGQHMEMAIMLREGRFDPVIDGKAIGGIETLEETPRTEVQKLATKRATRAEASAREAVPSVAPPPPGPELTMADAMLGKPPAKPRYRLSVQRSLTGGPAFYEPDGEGAIIGRDGAVALPGEKFCHPREAQLRWIEGRVWLQDLEAGNGVYLRIKQPVELEIGDEFIVGDQLLAVERNPVADDAPDPAPTYFYSSPKWPSSFRVVQVFEGGAKGACVVARGTTMLFGSAVGDFVFAHDSLVSEQHCLLEEQAGSIVLTDLESRTGVFVRIKGEQELVHGDELIVGRTRLLFELT